STARPARFRARPSDSRGPAGGSALPRLLPDPARRPLSPPRDAARCAHFPRRTHVAGGAVRATSLPRWLLSRASRRVLSGPPVRLDTRAPRRHRCGHLVPRNVQRARRNADERLPVRPAALFDVDRTLVTVNTARLYVRWRMARS